MKVRRELVITTVSLAIAMLACLYWYFILMPRLSREGHDQLVLCVSIIGNWVIIWTVGIWLINLMMKIQKKAELQMKADPGLRARNNRLGWVLLLILGPFPLVLDWTIKSSLTKLYISLIFFPVVFLFVWLFDRKSQKRPF